MLTIEPNDKLFGFAELSPDIASTLIISDIIARTEIFLADGAHIRLCAILSSLSEAIHSAKVIQQALYIQVLSKVISQCSTARQIAQACASAARILLLEELDRSTRSDFLRAVVTADPCVRSEIWWTLFESVDRVAQRTGPLFDIIIFLLTPIPNALPREMLLHLIPATTIDEWKNDVQGIPPMQRLAFQETLGQYSRKRKRTIGRPQASVQATLQACCPAILIGDNIFASLIIFIER